MNSTRPKHPTWTFLMSHKCWLMSRRLLLMRHDICWIEVLQNKHLSGIKRTGGFMCSACMLCHLATRRPAGTPIVPRQHTHASASVQHLTDMPLLFKDRWKTPGCKTIGNWFYGLDWTTRYIHLPTCTHLHHKHLLELKFTSSGPRGVTGEGVVCSSSTCGWHGLSRASRGRDSESFAGGLICLTGEKPARVIFQRTRSRARPETGVKEDAKLSPRAEIQAQWEIHCFRGGADGGISGCLFGAHGQQCLERNRWVDDWVCTCFEKQWKTSQKCWWLWWELCWI